MRIKIVDRETITRICKDIHASGQEVTMLNGAWDILHIGHVRLIQKAKESWGGVVVAVNSDASVRTLGKGDDRPIIPQDERAEMLAALWCVDFVTIFDEPTPLELVKCIRPDRIIKGSDWANKEVVGRKEVESWGGRVEIIPLEPGYSTTSLIERIRRMG